MYAEITARAAAGDTRYVELKRDVDAFLGRQRLTIGQLPVDRVEGVSERVGPMRLRTDGVLPFSVTVSNDTDVSTTEAMDAYIAFRHETLSRMAATHSGRIIEAVIAPASAVGPDAFARQLACDCTVTSMIVDWWGPHGWVLSGGLAFDEELILSDARLDGEFAEMAEIVLDEYPDLRLSELRMTVRSLRVGLTSQQALALSRTDGVLSVDPLDDVADHYRGGVANVEVSNAPDVFVTHGTEVLGLSWDVGHWPEKREGR